MDYGSISDIPIYYYLIITALLLLGGAYFAAAETSLASVSRIRMISDADDGDKRAVNVLYVLDNFDKALTTLLIGNNIMHIACSSVATLFASKLWGNTGVTIASFVVAFVVFIFAEMIPKSYAKECCEDYAPRIAGQIKFLMMLLTPLSFLFSSVTSLMSRLTKSEQEDDLTITEEEFFDIIENIDEEDQIDENTTELVQSALEFTVTSAKDILIPVSKMVYIKLDMSDDELMSIISTHHFSRLPVINDDGSVEGILQIRKFLKAKIRGRRTLLSRSMLDAPYFIPDSMPIDDILPDMSAHKAHMAFVEDDYHSLMGIITVEDILEELVGEIYDEEEVQQ